MQISKQTVVERLIYKLQGDEYIQFPLPIKLYHDFKQVEKEQMIAFANSFYDDCVMEGGSLQQSAEDYYNETYGNKDNK
jgi:hypothetical protein